MVTQLQLAFLVYIWLWGKHSLLCTAETEGSSIFVPVLLLLLP